MTLLTVFSAPKPFSDPHIDLIQRNAIQSWQRLGEQVSVLLVGEEAGMTDVAAEYNLPVLAGVERNASGTPLVSSIFSLARQASDSPLMAYVNADILLMSDFLVAARQTAQILWAGEDASQPTSDNEPFLLIGQRWDLDVRQALDFSDGWEERLRADVRTYGRMHRPAGSDYFLFHRQAFKQMPDFAIGRAGWDNWAIFHAREQGWPVVDGTPSVMIVHQDHDYSHLPDGEPHYDHDESQANMYLAGGLKYMYMVLDANYQLAGGRIRRPPLTLPRLLRSIERRLMPVSGGMRGKRGALARRFRRMRRKLV